MIFFNGKLNTKVRIIRSFLLFSPSFDFHISMMREIVEASSSEGRLYSLARRATAYVNILSHVQDIYLGEAINRKSFPTTSYQQIDKYCYSLIQFIFFFLLQSIDNYMYIEQIGNFCSFINRISYLRCNTYYYYIFFFIIKFESYEPSILQHLVYLCRSLHRLIIYIIVYFILKFIFIRFVIRIIIVILQMTDIIK